MLNKHTTGVGAKMKRLVAILMAGCLGLLAAIIPASPAAAAPVSIDLWAKSGTMTLPGQPGPVPIWGYTTGPTGATDPVTAPGGPTLVVNQGDVVTITVHNGLTVATSLTVAGQGLVPDLTGAAPAGTAVYTFTADRPGTFLYEAGMMGNTQYQTLMGLHGALVVMPTTPGQAYGGAGSAYDAEAVVVLSELDPALNNSADPSTVDLRYFDPSYFMINGAVSPDTAPIAAGAGDHLLLRYLNVGTHFHSMATLGLRQRVIAYGGNPLTHPHSVVAETFGPGQGVDTIVEIPATAPLGAHYPVYDSNLMLHNSSQAGLGGMMTLITVGPATPPGGDTTGPVTSGVTYTPGGIGLNDTTITATVDDSGTGGSVIAAAEYFIDTVGAEGTGVAMTPDDVLDTATEGFTANLLDPLDGTPHTIFVRGQDAAGNWGATTSLAVAGGDAVAPVTSGVTLTPDPSNGGADVAVTATVDDTGLGDSAIVAGELFVGPVGAVGSGTAMTVTPLTPTSATLDGTITTSVLAALADGTHTVSVRGQDAGGNWSAVATATMTISRVGPTTSGLSLNLTTGAVTALADSTATGYDIVAAEYFLDTDPGAGAGTPMDPVVPDTTVTLTGTLSPVPSGVHTVFVRAQDALGNWGPVASLTFNGGDAAGPVTEALALDPNPSDGTLDVVLSATANDSANGGSNVVAAEYFLGTPGADGTGIPMAVNTAAPIAAVTATIPAASFAGSTTVHVHAQDSVGNWGPLATIDLVVDVTGPLTSGVVVDPTPNNGQLPVNSGTQAVRVTATIDDTATGGSLLAGAEGFIDTVGAPGTGFFFGATDGSYDEVSETVVADIPLTTVNLLPDGIHTIYVHGRDEAGNWGAMATATLEIERIPPTVVSIDLVDPNPVTDDPATVSFQVTFSESVLGVTQAAFTPVMGGGLTGASVFSVSGSGPVRTVTVRTGSWGGTLGLNLTDPLGIRDIAGNALSTPTLPVVGPVYDIETPLSFSVLGNTNPPTVGGTADDADIFAWSGTAFSRTIDASALGLASGADVDGFAWGPAPGSFYASFVATNTSVPGLGNVPDEDVVYYDGVTWSLFFDGSANGLSGNTDVDALSVVAGTLYFSVSNTTVPTGVVAAGHPANVYAWDGVSSSLAVDATAVGIPGGANLDGLVWVSATDFYASFAATSVTLPDGVVAEDEDVVHYRAPGWVGYFDGTAKGLTGANLDVDGFDVP